MSLVETSIDCVHQRLDRLSSKRKLDDYDDEDFSSDLVSVRMRKDEPNAVSSTCNHQNDQTQNSIHHRVSNARWVPCNSPVQQQQNLTGSLSKLQFFVRMMSESKTLVLQMDFDDTVKSVHERIQTITGIPLIEQRLIYRGKQLQWEQSLAECSIENDAGLQLVGRMRSTPHPEAWQMLDEMVSLICRLCKNQDMESSKYVKSRLTRYLSMIPEKNNETAAEHLQIFLSSCAPAALVMLYVSPYKGNKECADESIRQFISSSQTVLEKPQFSLCAPILLEICKLLGQVAHEDPLYSLCRSTLGSMVDTSLAIKDIFPFAKELASKLANDMLASIESPMNMGPMAPNVHDFSAFLLPLRTAIIKQLGFGRSVATPLADGDVHSLCFSEEITILYDIFTELMANMELCLQKMEQCLDVKERRVGEHNRPGWSQYLAILKELHGISRLYQGAESQFWVMLKHRKVCISYLIVRYAQRSDDHRWLLEHKDVTDFESRRHLAMMLLPEGKDDYDELHEMLIDRAQLLPESFEYIAHAEPDALRGGLFLEFKNEEATGPGVLREWFFLVCQALFDPQNALFVACPNDRRRFFPNPASKVDPLHLEYFTFSGRVIALALMHKVQVGIVFDRVFFLQLAGKSISLDDIRDADPYLHNSCKKILEMDAELIDSDDLSLTFVREVEELGSRKTIELCPGGKSLAVNSRNRGEYVSLLIHHCFVASISEQVAHFAQGFADILCNSLLQKFFFQSLELEDLDWMLHGSESAISVDDWKAHTEYNGFKETDLQILWFWKIVEEMSAEQRKVLLFFWTSVKYLPIEGFRGLASRLYLYKSQEASNRLPSSHTCFYRLCMPSYPTFSLMKEHFNVITQEHIGCSFGTW